MYCAQLWCRFKPSSNRRGALSKLYVAYHSILKILIGVSKINRNSPIFVHLNILTCGAVIKNLIHKFKCRIQPTKKCHTTVVSLKSVEQCLLQEQMARTHLCSTLDQYLYCNLCNYFVLRSTFEKKKWPYTGSKLDPYMPKNDNFPI